MSDATSVDATAVLFGLEDEFGVREVERIDAVTVKVMIEQMAREGPCPDCGVFTGTVKDRPVMRLKDVPAIRSASRDVVAETSAGLRRAVVSAEDVHPAGCCGAVEGSGDGAAAGAAGDGDRFEQSGSLRRRR